MGCVVCFFIFGVELKYVLICNYMDVNWLNDDFEFYIWVDDGGLFGVDIIIFFMVIFEVMLNNNSLMMWVDLCFYSVEFLMVEGDVFVGFVVFEGEIWFVQIILVIGNCMYVFNGIDWVQIDDDYYFCIVIEVVMGVDDCVDVIDFNGLLGGVVGIMFFFFLFDNIDVIVGGELEDGFECFFFDGNGGELENI